MHFCLYLLLAIEGFVYHEVGILSLEQSIAGHAIAGHVNQSWRFGERVIVFWPQDPYLAS